MIKRYRTWLSVWLLTAIGAVLVFSSHAVSGATLPLALDRVLNWADPLSGTESTFLGAFGDRLTKNGRPLCLSNNLANGAKLINLGSSARAFYRLTVLGDRFTVESASFTFDHDATTRVWLMLRRDDEAVSNKDAVVTKLAQAIGSQPDESEPIRYSDGSRFDTVAWVTGHARVRIHERKMLTIIEITPASSSPRNAAPRESPPPPAPATGSELPAQTVTDTAAKEALSVDSVLNWADPFAVTRSIFIETFQHKLTDNGSPCYYTGTTPTGGTVLGLGKTATAAYRLVGFGGKFALDQLYFTFVDDKPAQLSIRILPGANGVSTKDEVVAHLTQLLGSPPRNTGSVTYSSGGTYASLGWANDKMSLRLHEKDAVTMLSITPAIGRSSTRPTNTIPSTAATTKVAVNLDALLAHDTFWKWTSADFERQYVAKSERQDQPPQFEWLNASKERARFSRKLFSNIDTRLTMFAGSVKVEEAIVEFVNGRAARATVSFYNRGDSGDIAVQEFESIYKRIGQNLGQALKVSPKNQLGSSNAALRVTGWNWTAPTGIALLEYNDYTAQSASGTVQQPEFLRLKLAAPDQADWSMGRLTVGVGRMTIAKNVTRNPAGDVFIAGVPMVDQGAKGYCVAASCQRLFEYFQIPCDQHELANLVTVDSETGANIFSMQKSLAKIDGQFKVAFKPHINPELYYDNRRKRRVSLKEFSGIVKENTDKGAPLLWALEIGRFKEEPPLPGSGQTGGGHMRIVIGYNSARNQLLFTDSWGAGHELKRMDAADAYECTMGLYSMSPRGL